MPLLEIIGLRIDFAVAHGTVTAVDDVSLTLAEGETLSLVGESGSGKSVTALAIARLLPAPPARYVAGQILLDGQDTLRLTPSELPAIRGRKVSYIFQEPSASLNPIFRIGTQIREALRRHHPEKATDAEVVRLLKLVGIADPELRMRAFPHQMSGGMQQRAMIAMAVAARPKLLIADEPTTALDVTIQAQILDLLRALRHEFGMSLLLITHNLGIVAEFADRVAVMYAGQVVELSPARAAWEQPLHPYTAALLRSVPRLGADLPALSAISGTVPQLEQMPGGCRFHPRCPIARAECSTTPPALVEVQAGRWVRCPYWQSL